MIVTCPGCASKYRVRNEAVPAEGARMRCPKCETLFLAKPPDRGAGADDEFSGVPQTGNGAPPSISPFGPPPQQASQKPAPAPVTATFVPPAPQFGAPVPFAPPGPSPFGSPNFGQPPQQQSSPFGQPSPFGQQQQPQGLGASLFGPPSAASPFGASQPPQPSPFGAPSPFAAPSPFGGPAPFSGAAPGPFGASSPPQPRASGPLTAMMQTFDDSQLAASTAAPSPAPAPAPLPRGSAGTDDDPFARLDIGPQTNSPPSSPPPPERTRPVTQAPPRTSTSTSSSTTTSATPPPVRAVRGDPLAGNIGSWVALFGSTAAVIFGLAFAGWTSEALDLDASLMPAFEEKLGVRPPRSFQGADDMPLDELRRLAQAKESAGDLAGAAVAWRRVQVRDPADRTATTALPRVLTALGERLR